MHRSPALRRNPVAVIVTVRHPETAVPAKSRFFGASHLQAMKNRRSTQAVSVVVKLSAIGFGTALFLAAGAAAAQIKEPGNHPRYGFELDPHILVQHDQAPFGDEGFGLGLRATIPFMHNGPVPSINNNIGISFGADFAFFGDDDRCRRIGGVAYLADECSGMNIWFPVTGQWNFFFTPVVSVFGEVGLALQYQHWEWEGLCVEGRRCSWDSTDIDGEFVFWGGGRFLFSDRAGMTVRLGWPYVSIGASILF
jgi:hypothetical protein